MLLSSKTPPLTPQRAILVELLNRMVLKPELLTVVFKEDVGVLRVRVTAHPNDAKILVGKSRVHLNAVESLYRLLEHGKHQIVQFMDIESTTDSLDPYVRKLPNPKWPKLDLMKFTVRLAGLVFPQCDVELNHVSENDTLSRFDIKFQPVPSIIPLRQFSKALAVVMLPIGARAGRSIYTNVKK